jgi:hypothetical protein
VKVFLAGEGKAEIGSWSRDRAYREESPESGLLEVLLRRVRQDGWSVGDAICWKNIPKYVFRGAYERTSASPPGHLPSLNGAQFW